MGYDHLSRLHQSNHSLCLLESFSDNGRDSSGERVSKNVTFLRDVVCQSKLLQYVLGRNARENGATTLLQAIQLLFAHWSLEFSLDCPTHGFMTSRKVVYSHRKTWLMFEGRMLSVNIELLLHIANFFKYHLTNEYEATLFNHFQELPEDQKPRAWNGPLETGVRQIGTSWKGSYGKWLHQIMPETMAEAPYLHCYLAHQHTFTIRVLFENCDRRILAATSSSIHSTTKMGFKRWNSTSIRPDVVPGPGITNAICTRCLPDV